MSEESGDNSKSKCICLETLESTEADDILKLKCGHAYHTKCIGDWLIEHGTCPYCRRHDGVNRGPQETYSTLVFTVRSIETFNAFLLLILPLHYLRLIILSITENAEALGIDKHRLGQLYGAHWMLWLVYTVVSCRLVQMLHADLPKYRAAGHLCSEYLQSLYHWSIGLIALLVVEYLVSVYTYPICVCLLVIDIQMYRTYSKYCQIY